MYESELYLNDRTKIKKLNEDFYKERSYKHKVAAKIENTKSYQRPNKDNSITENLFKQKLDEIKQKNIFILKHNFILTERHSCLTDLNSLKETCLKEMFVNKIHLGHYLECETICDPYYTTGIHLLIKDKNGDIEQLALYNYESKSCDVDPKFIIPIGTKLSIKEPHLQLFSLDDNDFVIRVDSPTDVVINSYPESNKTIDELIKQGDRAFENSNFHTSFISYSQVIQESKDCNIYLKRCQVNLKLEKYYLAYLDSKHAIELDSNNEYAYYWAGRSNYQLRQFEKALDYFEKSLKINSNNKDTENEIVRTHKRLNEAKNGTYNFKELYEQYFKRENLYLDVADYFSNQMKITNIENKSKGVVAIDFIKKGTLLLANKAASAVFYNNKDFRLKSYNTIDCFNKKYKTRNESENITNLAYKIQDDPVFANKIYSLFGGCAFDRENIEHHMIDIKRIEEILKFNSFSIENPFEELDIIRLDNEMKNFKYFNNINYAEFEDDDNFEEEASIDEDSMQLDLASIDFDSSVYKNLVDLQIKLDNLNNQSGLWYLSSYFNHSCLANCNVRTIGDVQFFYSQKDIEIGEELTIRYFPPEWNYSEKIEHTLAVYGFKCDCKLCILDEQDLMRITREKLLNQIETKCLHVTGHRITVSESFTDMHKIKSTYLKRSEYQFQLVPVLQILAGKYRDIHKYKMSAQFHQEIFDILKDYNDFRAISLLKEIFYDYENCFLTEVY